MDINAKITFTRDELAAALRRRWRTSIGSKDAVLPTDWEEARDLLANQTATEIVNDILEHCDLTIPIDTIVVSSDRKGYIRTKNGWTNLTHGENFPFEHPKRPLRQIGKAS